MSFSNSRIFCLEDFNESSNLISRLLFIEKDIFNFTVTNSPDHALKLINEQAFDLYVVKNRLPEMSGVELCRRIREADSETPILFLTDESNLSECPDAIEAGVSECLILPASLDKLIRRIKQLLNPTPAGFTPQSRHLFGGTSFASNL
jgi:DNA-binding response OmpR family regulator